MATELLNPVTRELTHTSVGYGKYRGRKLKATLIPGDLLEFHIKGTRKTVQVPLSCCYMLAQIMTTEEDYKEKMAEYRQKKKAGFMRIRKPRKANFPYGKAIYKAIG